MDFHLRRSTITQFLGDLPIVDAAALHHALSCPRCAKTIALRLRRRSDPIHLRDDVVEGLIASLTPGNLWTLLHLLDCPACAEPVRAELSPAPIRPIKRKKT